MHPNWKYLSSIPFLGSLILLILNDFILKPVFHNFLTGKISDFAGLFVFVVFWAGFFPSKRNAIAMLTALAFIWWKMDYSSSFIRIFSLWVFPIQRVVDVTDLIALIVIPFALFFLNRSPRVLKFHPVLAAILAFFSFCATSIPEPEIKLEQPQYILFNPGIAIYSSNYDDDYGIRKLDSFYIADISSISGRKYRLLHKDDFEKNLILKQLDTQILEDVNVEGKYLNYATGIHELKIKDGNDIDEVRFNGTRLDGKFVRRNSKGKVIIEGYYHGGIEDSTWMIIDTNTQLKTIKQFKNGETIKIQHLNSIQLLDEEKVLTRSEVITQKYVHLIILFSLSLILVFLLYRNYRSDFSEQLKVSIGWKIALAFILPFFIFLLTTFISSVIPYAFGDNGGDFFRSITNMIIIYFLSTPLLLLIFFTISFKNTIDIVWYCFLFALLFNLWFELQQLNLLIG